MNFLEHLKFFHLKTFRVLKKTYCLPKSFILGLKKSSTNILRSSRPSRLFSLLSLFFSFFLLFFLFFKRTFFFYFPAVLQISLEQKSMFFLKGFIALLVLYYYFLISPLSLKKFIFPYSRIFIQIT